MLQFQTFYQEIDLDSVYEALDLEPIGKSGDEDIFHCPDFDGAHKHGDTTGKFAINREKVVGQCWVCGGISLPHLVSRIKGITDEEAIQWLYKFTDGGSDEEAEFLARLDRIFEVKKKENKPLPYYNPSVLDPWLRHHRWFDDRLISEEIREKYFCGYNLEWDAIVLPHFWKGKLVGWQSRNLNSMPKYIFSPDFPRSETLWGLDGIEGIPFVVESIPTALRLLTEGRAGIATFGSNVSDIQIRQLRRFGQGVVLAPDNDEPGKKWFKRIYKELSPYVPVYAVDPVPGIGNDLGDLPESMLEFHIDKTLRLVFDENLFLNV